MRSRVILRLRPEATPAQRAAIARALAARVGRGPVHAVHTTSGDLFVCDGRAIDSSAAERLAQMPGVARLQQVETPYQLASRAAQPEKTVVRVADVRVGAGEPVIVAGPCSVEGEREMLEAARAARAAGAQILRGGAFKPRTSPYSFQGLSAEGVALLARAGRAVGLPVVTEVMEPGLVECVAEHADMLQVGSRNMQNFPLLRAVGRAQRPVLLKRGFAATIDEWLLAAEYIMLEGNAQVVLCERGIRGFDPQTRNVLDLACVPLLTELTHLPVLVDPSHATGRRDLVVRLGVAAVAAGADGVMVEMRPRPEHSVSDAEQTISPDELHELVERITAVHRALAAL